MKPYRLILPYPFEPVTLDLDRPLEEQMSGEVLERAKVMLDMLRKSMAMESQ